MEKTFVVTEFGNEILEGDGFCVSFRCSESLMALSDLFKYIATGEAPKETTLIKEGENAYFYVLRGDFRKDYLELIDQGFDACHAFYLSQEGTPVYVQRGSVDVEVI